MRQPATEADFYFLTPTSLGGDFYLYAMRHFHLATLVLLGTLGCAKKDDPAAEPAKTTSYVLDGRFVTCTAKQDTSSHGGYQYLTIVLTTTPQPSTGPEILDITFYKPTPQPASAFVLTPVGGMALYNYATRLGSNNSGLGFYATPIALQFTSSGVSGSFAGEARQYSALNTYTITHTITAGNFIDVRL